MELNIIVSHSTTDIKKNISKYKHFDYQGDFDLFPYDMNLCLEVFFAYTGS